jgi:hypothetical protein
MYLFFTRFVYQLFLFFYKLRTSREQVRDRHSNLVGTPIISCPPPITHIIIKKKKNKYIQKLGGDRPNPVSPHKTV